MKGIGPSPIKKMMVKAMSVQRTISFSIHTIFILFTTWASLQSIIEKVTSERGYLAHTCFFIYHLSQSSSLHFCSNHIWLGFAYWAGLG